MTLMASALYSRLMQIDQIRDLTLSLLPEQLSPDQLKFEVIEKGGSGRIFVRVTDTKSNQSWVAMSYTNDRSDNARFASITDFLFDKGIAVPQIVGRKEDIGFLLVQDLGNVDLGHYHDKDWETVRRPAYEASFDAVFPLHQITWANKPANLPELEFCFDAELYQWEQDYFYNHYITNFSSADALKFRDSSALSELRDWLTELPRALVHRDFQSTNVMFKDQQCYMIDYQGMRFGLPEYDVASMVYDPYVELTNDQREHLITYYYQLKQAAGHPQTYQDYRKVFDACAMQRLMQALGAYGFLGLVKQKKEFLQHIEPAKQRLQQVAQSICPEMII